MRDLKNILVKPNSTVRDALLLIDSTGTQMALVVDEHNKLLGTLSDGDIRRGLLKGLTLSDSVDRCMFITPHKAFNTDSNDAVVAIMRREKLHQMPIVDASNTVVGLEVLDDYILPTYRENWVVIMAGGLGSRLGELTKNTPKPMLKVGDRPLLETILRNFIELGFANFYISVNYLAEIIEEYFGNGERFGANIRYLRENQRLGTAGSLSLLPHIPTEPVIVANGDLLANINFANMLDVHVDSGALATMGVSEYEFQIPYGVVNEVDGNIQKIVEKPVHKSLISAGVYVISPEALEFIPSNTFFDMPSLFDFLIKNERKASVYKVGGYWLDIGRASDYQKANADIDKIF